MEEQELAERCRQGDNLARKELYERYAGRMLSVCLRYAGDLYCQSVTLLARVR